MDKTVARLNIEHFQKKLATETDETGVNRSFACWRRRRRS